MTIEENQVSQFHGSEEQPLQNKPFYFGNSTSDYHREIGKQREREKRKKNYKGCI